MGFPMVPFATGNDHLMNLTQTDQYLPAALKSEGPVVKS